ncbi:integral membrane protein [Chitinophaga ginsengisegetis]|uniref:Integral membrane protein n=1 Tax=Chitinophaga ginsengisegetis TaxID=393003 RepID=A0A1T5PB58_9BACT|nr:DUF3817 domain-containing protein [Chitinophaga ginsengisegetis]MDR6571306.1 integral membrane protein [Chitinophaga ginsengisegetis]MDR6651040.1 integral membrane protein [Chitinophaga ginsengisegetis]MDR6657390.1 integral membrane protein [Chitinophaga ginsengisegetis]SKD09974.1 integral membrane protein [Chitinophaga ginsengisegetis]
MINLYRKTALIEAVSYLILLFVAMPMKYIFSVPEPVKYFGWLHGVLFIAFIALLLSCWIKYRWSIVRVAGFFVGSLLPFVPFIFEKKLKEEYGN